MKIELEPRGSAEGRTNSVRSQPKPKHSSIPRQRKWLARLELAILALSVLANIYLWREQTSFEERLREADFNDRAWEALSTFQSNYDETMVSVDEEHVLLLREESLDLVWVADLEELNKDWVDEVRRAVTRLDSQMAAYSSALENEEALRKPIRDATREISSLEPPSQDALDLVIRELVAAKIRSSGLEASTARQSTDARILEQVRGRLEAATQKARIEIQGPWHFK